MAGGREAGAPPPPPVAIHTQPGPGGLLPHTPPGLERGWEVFAIPGLASSPSCSRPRYCFPTFLAPGKSSHRPPEEGSEVLRGFYAVSPRTPPKSQHLPLFLLAANTPFPFTSPDNPNRPLLTKQRPPRVAPKSCGSPFLGRGSLGSFGARSRGQHIPRSAGLCVGARRAELTPSCCSYYATSAAVHTVPARGRRARWGSDRVFPPGSTQHPAAARAGCSPPACEGPRGTPPVLPPLKAVPAPPAGRIPALRPLPPPARALQALPLTGTKIN